MDARARAIFWYMEPRLSSLPAAASPAQRPSLAHAMRRGWLLTALLVIVFGALAAAVGLARHPTYEAETLVVVGKVDVQTPGLSGFVATTQSLASAYSRAIQTNAVLKPAGKTLGLTPRQLGSEVSASPIPRARSSESRPTRRRRTMPSRRRTPPAARSSSTSGTSTAPAPIRIRSFARSRTRSCSSIS